MEKGLVPLTTRNRNGPVNRKAYVFLYIAVDARAPLAFADVATIAILELRQTGVVLLNKKFSGTAIPSLSFFG